MERERNRIRRGKGRGTEIGEEKGEGRGDEMKRD